MDTPGLMIPAPGWADKELETVQGYVRESLPASLQPFWDSNAFGLAGFGRRPLRPYLVLLVARHYGCAGERPLRLAASIHMIHMASLLHDRLGLASGASGSGEDAAQERHRREALDILLGDFFFSKASCFIVEDGEKRIIEEHIRTSLDSAETQARLVSLEGELDRVEAARCFEVTADKVSLLLSLSLRVGAILGGAPREEEEIFAGCGFLLGRGVKILDDLSAWERLCQEGAPPPAGARFAYPLLLIWEREGRQAWDEAVRQVNASGTRQPEDLRTMLNQKGYWTASQRSASDFFEKALHRLEGLAETEELRWLHEAARFYSWPSRRAKQEVSP